MHGSTGGEKFPAQRVQRGSPHGSRPAKAACRVPLSVKRPREAWDEVKLKHVQLQLGEEPSGAHPELQPPKAPVNVTAALYSS